MEESKVPEETVVSKAKVSKPRKKRRLLVKFLALIVALGGVALVLAPYGIKWGALHWFAQQGLANASIEDVDLNLFTGKLVIEGLDGGGEQRLKAGRAEVAWRTTPLLSRKLYITAVGLYDAAIDVELASDGSITAGGLKVPLSSTEEKESTEVESSTWGMGLESVTVENISLSAKEPRLALTADVKKFSTGAVSTWEPDQDTPISLDMLLNDAPVSVDGMICVLAPDKQVDLTASIQNFAIETLAQIANEQGIQELKGTFSTSQHISGELLFAQKEVNLNSEGRVEIKQVSVSRDDANVTGENLDWDGALTVEGNWQLPKMGLKGTATLAQVSAASGVYALFMESGTANMDASLTLPVPTQIDAEWSLEATGTGLLASSQDMPSIPVADVVFTPEKGVASEVALTSEGTLLVNIAGAVKGKLTTHITATGPALFAQGGDEPVILAEHFKSVLSDAELGGTAEAPVYSGVIKVETVGGRVASSELGYAMGAGSLKGSLGFEVAEASTPIVFHECNAEGTSLVVEELSHTATLANVQTMSFTGKGGTGDELLIGDLQLVNAQFVDRAAFGAEVSDASRANLMQFSALNVSNIRLNPSKPTVGEVQLEDLLVFLRVEESGKPELLAWLEGEASDLEAVPPEAPVQSAAEMELELIEEAAIEVEKLALELPPFQVGSVQVVGENRISLRDESVNPTARIDLEPFSLQVGSMDSTTPDALTSVSFNGKLGEYSSLKLEGEISPFALRPSGVLVAQAEGVDLHEITAYVERYTGYRLNRGTLDSKIDLKLDTGVIDANSEILIAKLEMERLKAEELDPFEEQLGMPVNAALSLLRNREDQIKLAIPVTGDFSDPKIDVSDAVGKAVMRGTAKAVKTGVMAYFAPVGVAMLVGKAAKKAGELSFDPVEFSAGDASLDDADREYLDTLTELLLNRPKVSLTLCGFSTRKDLAFFEEALRAEAEAAALSEAAADSESEGEPSTTPEETVPPKEIVVPPVQEDTLLDLASARADAVKAYLVEVGGIDAARLYSCAPTYESEDEEAPGVAIRL